MKMLLKDFFRLPINSLSTVACGWLGWNPPRKGASLKGAPQLVKLLVKFENTY